MGGFYGSVHVKTADRSSVQQAAEAISKRQKTRFLIGPPLNGWVSAYPETHGQDESIAKAMARRAGGDVIYVMVHDDDVFAYSYFQDGKLVDAFNSRPDYFGSVPAKTKAKLRGRPLLIQHLLAPGKSLKELIALLSPDATEQTPFAFELLERFANLLGLPNAVAAYEYLMEGETEHIQDWDDFIHVPDQSEEKARKRAAAAASLDEKERLRQAGILVYEAQGDKKGLTTVAWCPDHIGNGFFVFWQNYHEANPGARPLERLAPPWSAGPTPTSFVAGPFVHQLRLSPSGRLLAIGNASGNWRAVVWDLEQKKQICEIANDPHTAPFLLFSPDEKYLIGHAYDGVVVYATATGERVAKHANCIATYAAMHPSGLLAIGDPAGKLIVYDPLPGRRINTLCLGQQVDYRHLHASFVGRVQQELDQLDPDALRQQMEKQFARMAQYIRPPKASTNTEVQQAAAAQGFVFSEDGTFDVKKTVADMLEKMRISMQEQQRRMAEARNRPGVESEAIKGSEQSASLLCSPDGRWLFCGTDRGLRVYDWAELLAAKEITPPPRHRVDIAPVTVETESGPMPMDGRVQALAFDPTANRLLFAAVDGVIRCLDLSGGLHRTLLEIPSKTPVYQMEHSSERQYLCCTTYEMHRNHNGPPTLQVWNYSRLAERLQTNAGLRLFEGDESGE
jgi:hypothetical protein